MNGFIQTYQLALLLGCFVTGTLCTVVLFRLPRQTRVWKLADLAWVLLGGLGAVTAITAGIYRDDSSQLARRIDIAFAASQEFDLSAARFRLRYCETPDGQALAQLCEKVEFLSASTAANSALPLFISATAQAAPLQGLNFLVRSGPNSLGDMMEKVETFDPNRFLAFDPRDAGSVAALRELRPSSPVIAADYQILATAYDGLIDKVTQLKTEWEYLQANAHFLVLQIIALCLVSIAAPFRVGKSIYDLKN